MKKPVILVIAGPTATGKTRLSLEISAELCGEIISADSMQLYRGMDIGTAKAAPEERGRIPHHLIDILDPHEEFSVADYVEHANAAAGDIVSRGRLPVVAGGTGLYISSFMDNIKFSRMSRDEAYRLELDAVYKEKGGEYLLSLLRKNDPQTAAKLHENDAKRIIRALEIYKASGKTQSEWDVLSKENPSPYDFYPVLLTYSDREKLYDAINNRVDTMMERGLLKEAEALYGRALSRTAKQAIGYKELLEYFNGNTSLNEAVGKIKQASRRLAKRQLTWFCRDSRYKRIEVDTSGIEKIKKTIIFSIRN